MREHLKLTCWRCRELLDEAEAVTVKTNPELPEWMSRSTTKVHQRCVDERDAKTRLRR